MRKIKINTLGIILSISALITVFFVGRSLYYTISDYYLSSKYPLRYAGPIMKCYEDYGLSPAFVSAVIYEESRFNSDAHSIANAVGLMQIVPETGQYLSEKMGEENFNPESLKDSVLNIAYGCYYLDFLMDKYQEKSKVLAAYNAGPGSVDQWIEEGDYEVKFHETEQFVERVLKTEGVYQDRYFNQIPD